MNRLNLQKTDPAIFEIINNEQERQRSQLQMIPSENNVSQAVMEALGSPLMNKYSEGQPFKRFYQGAKYIDQLEALVKERALEAFGLDKNIWSVNVQAVTGSVANLSVYNALLEIGDKILGMHLYDGGHLSHGWKLPDGKKISFTSRAFESAFYHVEQDTEVFDYDNIEKIAVEEQPQIIVSGGTAYPREINHKRMREIADKVGAYYMADIAHEAGLVLAGVHGSPFEYAHVVTMTTRKTLRGPVGAMIFSRYENEVADKIDKSVFPGMQGGPMNHSIGGIGVALQEAMQPAFKEYAAQIIKNAQKLAEELTNRGFRIVSGGTDKHLVLVDMRSKNLTGKVAALTLENINIITNKNTVPFDTSTPWNPSGIRMGTPAITGRGMKEEHMAQIAEWIDIALQNHDGSTGSPQVLEELAEEVKAFALSFPIRVDEQPADLSI